MNLTPKQIETLRAALALTTTDVEVRKWSPNGRAIEANYFDRGRLITSLKIQPGGSATVLAEAV